jgi:hypothetical protein
LAVADIRASVGAVSLESGIFLATVGGLIRFGLRLDIWWLDTDALGVVLMFAGAAMAGRALWVLTWTGPRPPPVEYTEVLQPTPHDTTRVPRTGERPPHYPAA